MTLNLRSNLQIMIKNNLKIYLIPRNLYLKYRLIKGTNRNNSMMTSFRILLCFWNSNFWSS